MPQIQPATASHALRTNSDHPTGKGHKREPLLRPMLFHPTGVQWWPVLEAIDLESELLRPGAKEQQIVPESWPWEETERRTSQLPRKAVLRKTPGLERQLSLW